jgi:hypothetical protein
MCGGGILPVGSMVSWFGTIGAGVLRALGYMKMMKIW